MEAIKIHDFNAEQTEDNSCVISFKIRTARPIARC